jgi:hypothetical protein
LFGPKLSLLADAVDGLALALIANGDQRAEEDHSGQDRESKEYV